MAKRDYDSSPASDELGLVQIIRSLAKDLDELRDGRISVNDAMARAMIARQIFNGVRLYLNGTKLLSQRAKEIEAEKETTC